METVNEISTIQQSSYLARDEEPTENDSTSPAARRTVRGKNKNYVEFASFDEFQEAQAAVNDGIDGQF